MRRNKGLSKRNYRVDKMVDLFADYLDRANDAFQRYEKEVVSGRNHVDRMKRNLLNLQVASEALAVYAKKMIALT